MGQGFLGPVWTASFRVAVDPRFHRAEPGLRKLAVPFFNSSGRDESALIKYE